MTIKQEILEKIGEHRQSHLADPELIIMSQHQERELIGDMTISEYSIDVDTFRLVEFHGIPVEVREIYDYGNGEVIELSPPTQEKE